MSKWNKKHLRSQPLSWWDAVAYLQLRKLLNVDSTPALLCHLIQRVYQRCPRLTESSSAVTETLAVWMIQAKLRKSSSKTRDRVYYTKPIRTVIYRRFKVDEDHHLRSFLWYKKQHLNLTFSQQDLLQQYLHTLLVSFLILFNSISFLFLLLFILF